MPQPTAEEASGKTLGVPEIPLDAEERVVKRLLDAFTCETLSPSDVNIDASAMKLAVLLNCPLVKERLVTSTLGTLTSANAWTAFTVFAQMNDYRAARQAISALDPYVRRDLHAISAADAETIPIRYLIGLLRAVSNHPSKRGHFETKTGMYDTKTSWEAISRDFKVAE